MCTIIKTSYYFGLGFFQKAFFKYDKDEFLSNKNYHNPKKNAIFKHSL